MSLLLAVLFVQKQVSHFAFILAGRLELKIPWKNLYTQSVEATLDGVYLLIVPLASKSTKNEQSLLTIFMNIQNIEYLLFPGIKYDAEKEEKQLQEARQRKLQQIETKLTADEGQGSALI